jgi:hypothetical protein
MADPEQIEFSYTVFWTRQVLGWDAARRAAVRAALGPVIAQPDFVNNAFSRQYTVAGLDDQAHAGASLLALDKVLTALTDTN